VCQEERLTQAEFAVIFIELARSLTLGVDEDVFFSKEVTSSLFDSAMLPPAGEPNNTMMFMSQGGQSEDIAATYRDHFVQYLRFLSEEIIQKAPRHEVTQALQSYWQHLLQDRESACVRVSKFAPDHQALIGASSKSDRRRGLSGMSYAAPLMISAVSRSC